MSFCVLSSEREGSKTFHQYILIYNSYKEYNKHRCLKLYCVEDKREYKIADRFRG